jgi:hypothetical protein
MLYIKLAALWMLLTAFGPASAFSAYKVEKIGNCTAPSIADEVKTSLQHDGYRVSGDSGPICEVWLRKTVALKTASAKPDYGSLTAGQFLGVIVYASSAGDFKGQGVKPGAYTLRFQSMPADGNHMGVSPTQDYFLLVPAELDKNPEAGLEYEQLLGLSRKAAKTPHPAPLYLTSPSGAAPGTFVDAGDGHWALQLMIKGQTPGAAEIDFPVALVLVGKGEV